MTMLPPRDGMEVLEITGELDLFVAPDLRCAVADVAEEGRHVCLDVAGVQFLDSTALAALLRIRRDMRDRGLHLVLVGAAGQVAAALDHVGVDGLLPRYATVDDAVAGIPR